jgi:hypothetical protein
VTLKGLKAWIPMMEDGPVFGVDKSPIAKVVDSNVNGMMDAMNAAMNIQMFFGVRRTKPNTLESFTIRRWDMPLYIRGFERPSFFDDIKHESYRRIEPELRRRVNNSRVGSTIQDLAYWLGYIE